MGDCVARLLTELQLRPRFLRYLDEIFDDIDLSERRFLDIGAGNGVFSFFAGCRGAQVVALEPEAAGSRTDMRRRFEQTRRTLELDSVELLPLSLQGYEPNGRVFDVALMHNVINHLHEADSEVLHFDPGAQERYVAILHDLSRMIAEGGRLIIKEVARRNLWGDGRIRNPFSPSIEWHKHQPPELWASLLQRADFQVMRTRWLAPHRLPDPAQRLLKNKFGAYLFTSAFVIDAIKADGTG